MPLQFRVGEVPRTKPFQFADLAELLILTRLNSQVSKADLDGLIRSATEDSDPEFEGLIGDQLDEQLSHDRNAEDCFRHLAFRAGALDEHYPFLFQDALLTRCERVSELGFLYLFLLVCSRLGSFAGRAGFAQDCARQFTELSAVALGAALKGSARVYVFDAGSADRANHFHTDLRKALRALANKLNALAIDDLVNQQSASGDGGIDLVAINEPGDPARGVLAYFGQCAAQQNGWPRKTLESVKANAFFSMGHGAANLLYTPVMYRNASGRWVNDLHSHDCVIMDRLRTLRALKASGAGIPAQLFANVQRLVHEAASVEL
jgi:hypothetical protein